MAYDALVHGLGARFTLASLSFPASSARYIQRSGSAFAQVLGDFAGKAQAPPPHPYVVKKGDYLTKIVQEELKEAGISPTNQAVYEGVRKVAVANGLADADRLHPGQRLDLSILATGSGPVQPSTGLRVHPPASLEARSSAAYMAKQAQGGPLVAAAETPSRFSARLSGRSEVRVDLTDLIDRILGNRGKAFSSIKGQSWATLSEPGQVTSGFGMRADPFTKRPAFHPGVDLAAATGATIYPIKSGTVKYAGYAPGYGNMVVVDHGDGLESVYGHNAANRVRKGQKVTELTALGEVGSTGRSTGPHLHFEIRKEGRPVNPMPYLEAGNVQMAGNQ